MLFGFKKKLFTVFFLLSYIFPANWQKITKTVVTMISYSKNADQEQNLGEPLG